LHKGKRAKFRASILNQNPLSQLDLEKYLDQRYKVRKTIYDKETLNEISIDVKSRRSIMKNFGKNNL
jgi:hypothetical protein